MSLGSNENPSSTGTHIFQQKPNISAGSMPHRMRREVGESAGKRCSVVLKQHITALHLQSPSLGQPQCIQAGSGHSVCGRETNRQTFEIVTATKVLSMVMLKSLFFIFSHSRFIFFFFLISTDTFSNRQSRKKYFL